MTEASAAFTVEQWDISRVLPYENNPRIITEAAITKVAESIRQYGWRQPIVVDTAGVVIVGHTRLRAAKHLGLTSVPVHVAASMTPEQVRAYRIADNRVADETDWDRDILISEIGDLIELNVDMTTLGFDKIDLDKLLGDEFAPELFPERTGTPPVTEAAMERAEKSLTDDPKKAAHQDLIDLTCPHCGQTYAVQRKSITG